MSSKSQTSSGQYKSLFDLIKSFQNATNNGIGSALNSGTFDLETQTTSTTTTTTNIVEPSSSLDTSLTTVTSSEVLPTPTPSLDVSTTTTTTISDTTAVTTSITETSTATPTVTNTLLVQPTTVAPVSTTSGVYTVSTADQLQSALKTAQAGDVIKLAAGNYGDLVINNTKFASNVTITSMDASNPATFNTIKITGSSGITFDQVSVKFTPDATTVAWTNAVYIYQSSDVSFVNSKLVGGPAVNGVPITATTLDSTQNVLGLPAGRAIFVFNSSNVEISGNDIQQFHKGVLLANASEITISNNEIHDLRTTPISGSNVSNVTIEKNYLHDSKPWNFSGAGDHGDFIHLWTNPAQAGASDTIVIRNNYLNQGNGTALLGIYLDDDQNGIGFSNVDVSDNVIINNNSQAIRLENVDGSVTGNTLLKASVTTSTQINPSVYALDGSNVVISGNIYTRSVTDSTSTSTDTANSLTNNAILSSDYVVSVELVKTGEISLQENLQTTTSTSTSTSSSTTSSLSSSTTQTALPVDRIGTDGNDSLADRGVYSILTGKGGNDQYVVDHAQTQVVEAANGGTDGVSASIDFTLSANVENLTLRASAINGVGNDLGNQMRGNTADNVLYGQGGNDTVLGGDGNDTIYGGDGTDRLHGEAGNDYLYGDAGDDWLSGYAGNDKLFGGDGADQLRGGPGSDTLTGGKGADKFYFESADFVAGQPSTDWIADFSRVEGDRINLQGIDANVATTADDKFSFIGTSAFKGTAGELRYEFVGSDTYVYGDANGDRVADIVICLTGNIGLIATDFVL